MTTDTPVELATDRVHSDELVTSRAIGWGHFKPSRWGQIELTNPILTVGGRFGLRMFAGDDDETVK